MVSKEDVAALYVALFNRAPEGVGLDNWYNATLLNNWGVGELAESMLLAAQQIVSSNPEYQSIYPQYVNVDPKNVFSVKNIIETVYKTLFDKTYLDDPTGIDYWVQNVISGVQSIGEAVASIEIVAKQIALGEILAYESTVKAAKTFLNRIEAALIVAENIRDFDGDFIKFQNYILLVNDDPKSLYDLINQLTFNNNSNNDFNNDNNNLTDDLNSNNSNNNINSNDLNNNNNLNDNADINDSDINDLLDSILNLDNLVNNIDNGQDIKQDDNQNIDTSSCKVLYDSNPIETISSDKLYIFDSLYSGQKWNMETITYSFPSSIPSDYLDTIAYNTKFFSSPNVFTSEWQSLNNSEKEKVKTVLKQISDITNINFIEISDGNGYIRFSKVLFDNSKYAGFSFYPGCSSIEGDVFLNKKYLDDTNISDNNKLEIILHEVGHALGLKHPFEGLNTLPKYEDNNLYTVMSYTPYKPLVVYFDKNNIQISYSTDATPVTFQLYDVLVLQAMYGKNLTKTSGNDTYNLSNLFNKHIYMTLWDSGGIDTLDVSDATYPSYINLNDGSFSSVDYHSLEDQRSEIVSYLDSIGYSTGWVYDFFNRPELQEDLYTGENNLAIAYGTIIENVRTGSGDDKVWDNSADNYIYTGSGDDIIYLGAGGNDTVDGGDGYDTVIINDSSTNYSLERANGYISISNGVEYITLNDVEEVKFLDNSIIL